MNIKMNALSGRPGSTFNSESAFQNDPTTRIPIGAFMRLEQVQYQYDDICKLISALEEVLAPVLLAAPKEDRNTGASQVPETELERRIIAAEEQMQSITHKLEQLCSRIVI